MSLLRNNLLPRLHLLRIAFTQRFIYRDLIKMARDYGVDYEDVRGNLGPFDLATRVLGAAGPTPPSFAALTADAARFTPPDAPTTFNSEPSVARFLGQLVYHCRATTVIELGCFVGWTTAHLAAGMKAHGQPSRVHALDYMQRYLDTTRENLQRHGLADMLTTVRGMSLESSVMAQLPARADVIFLDTSHAYPDTRDEILAYAPRLSPGGCLVLHDCTSASGVRRSVVEVQDRFDVHIFATERGNGVAVLFPR